MPTLMKCMKVADQLLQLSESENFGDAMLYSFSMEKITAVWNSEFPPLSESNTRVLCAALANELPIEGVSCEVFSLAHHIAHLLGETETVH